MLKNKDTYLLWLMWFLMWNCFSGCATQKNAEKYYALHPVDLATKCAAEYPAKVTPGIVVRSVDTSFLPGPQIPCPEAKKDSAGKPEKVFVQCPPEKTIHDKQFVHDTILDVALVESLKGDTAGRGRSYRVQTEQLNTVTGEKNKAEKEALKLIICLISLLGVDVILIILKWKNVI